MGSRCVCGNVWLLEVLKCYADLECLNVSETMLIAKLWTVPPIAKKHEDQLGKGVMDGKHTSEKRARPSQRMGCAC